MDYIAVLDHDHLDNGIFLTAFARSLGSHKGKRGLIIHGDSAYTDRLIQTGVMREDAELRAIRDLNHRLIALLADNGISAIGLNGHQRSILSFDGEGFQLNRQELERLPDTPHIVLSSLFSNHTTGATDVIPLQQMALVLQKRLNIEDVIIFNMDDSEEIIDRTTPESVSARDLGHTFPSERVPVEFRNPSMDLKLMSARSFARYPEEKKVVIIRP